MKDRLKAWWPLAVLLAGVWPLWLNPAGVPFAPHSAYTDALIAHIRNADYWKHWVWQGQWPLWNLQIFGGLPFAGDPLAGLWYPPLWVLLVVPVELGFNLLVVAHLALAAWALRQYLLASGVPDTAATWGGLAFALTPKTLAHWGAGHLTLLMALSWTPVVLWTTQRAWRAGTARAWLVVGAVVALAFLADPRWLPWVAVSAVWAVGAELRGPVTWADVWARGRGAMAALAVAVLLAGALWVPMLELALNSPRQALTLAEAGIYSVTALDWLKLLIPAPQAGHETFIYLGVAVMTLAGLGVTRRTALWLALAGLSALLAMGVNGPLYPLVFNLPGANLLRVPARAWLMVALAVSVLAAHGLARLPDLWRQAQARARAPWLRRMPAALVMLAFGALWLADVARLAPLLVEFRPRPPLTPAAAWVHAQNVAEPFRVYSPSFSFGDIPRLQQLDGVNPLYLTGNVAVVAAASGLPAPNRYTVILPPLAEDNPDMLAERRAAQPNGAALAQWNVRYVAADFPLTITGFALVQVMSATHIYAAQVETPRLHAAVGTAAAVQVTPNRITAQVDQPGEWRLSDIAFAGWQVWVNGAPGEACAPTLDWMRCVVVRAAPATLVWEYRPAPVGWGLLFSGLGVALCVAGGLRRPRTARRPA